MLPPVLLTGCFSRPGLSQELLWPEHPTLDLTPAAQNSGVRPAVWVLYALVAHMVDAVCLSSWFPPSHLCLQGPLSDLGCLIFNAEVWCAV